MIERKYDHNERKDRKFWQRNRNFKKEPNGNSKTEMYSIQNKSKWMSLILE